MTPYFSYEAPSAFKDFSHSAIAVLVTFPAENEWYVIMDKKSALPLFETDSPSEAKTMAEQFAKISDLAFLSTILSDKNSVRYVEGSLSCSMSRDGLNAIPDNMVQSAVTIAFDGDMERATENNNQWTTWEASRDTILSNQPRTLVFGFDTKVEERGDDGVELVTQHVIMLAEMDWGISDLKKIDLKMLDGDHVVNGEPLRRLLWHVESSPKHEIWVETADELDDWRSITDQMPLFQAYHKPEQSTRIYAYEGGQVLEKIAATRPWLVEKDAQGNPVPLRIVEAPAYQDFGEKGLKEDQQFIAAVFLGDALTDAARKDVIEAQRTHGIEFGQVTPHGQFVKVAELEAGVVLEAMFDRTTPNIIGTRDWVNYRLWIEGELVLDVHPGNAAQYAERMVSISPLGGPALDSTKFSMTSDQIGDLLATALSESADPEDNEVLPERVANFLHSGLCEELQGDAQDIERGDAVIENGKFVRLKSPDAEDAPEFDN